mgnify:CR=1 FL=1
MADSDTDYRLERLTPERLPDLVALHAATYGPGLTLDDARRNGGMLLVEWGQGFEAALGGAADAQIRLSRADDGPSSARTAELRGAAFAVLGRK